MRLLGVRLEQLDDKSFRDTVRTQEVTIVGIDRKSVVALSISECHFMDKGRIDMSKVDVRDVGPANVAEDDASNGRVFATA